MTAPEQGQPHDRVRLAPAGALPRGAAVTVDVDGDPVALFHTRDGYRALAGRCPHMAAPLSQGKVVDDAVVCPLHAWRYDLVTGARTDRPGQATQVYPTEIRDGWLYLGLPRQEVDQ